MTKMTVTIICAIRPGFRRPAAKIAVALDGWATSPAARRDILSAPPAGRWRAVAVADQRCSPKCCARGIKSPAAHNYQTMLAHYGYLPEREEERLTSLLPAYNIDG